MIGIRKSPVFIALLFVMAGVMLSLSAYAKGPNNGPGPDLTEEAEHYIYFMREEEQMARDTYRYLDLEWGDETPVFANIARSEQSHMEAMMGLMDNYGLDGPVIRANEWWSDPDNLFQYATEGEEDLNALITLLLEMGLNSREEAVFAGALIEETDIIDIQHAIDESEGFNDIVSVYENLMCGSRNHLRAFWANIVAMGLADSYDPILDEDEFEKIVGDGHEDCGSSNRNRGK